MISRICQQCDAAFKVKEFKVLAGGGRFCSRPCYYKSLTGHQPYNANTAETIWSRIAKGQSDECWQWLGLVSPDGYGQVSWTGTTARAHRLIYELVHGQALAQHQQVLHMCEGHYSIGDLRSRLCCNPSHLKLGGPAENVQDQIASGRVARGDRAGSRTHPERRPRGDHHASRLRPETVLRGEQHGGAKLSEEAVGDIRLRFAIGGVTYREVAREYSVDASTIGRIVRRQNWTHLMEPDQ